MSRREFIGITVGLLAFLLAQLASLDDVSNCRVRMGDPRLKEQLTAAQLAYCTTVLQRGAVPTTHKL